MSETPLTPEREQEIRAREAAATEGPWGTYHENPQSDYSRLIDVAADLQETGTGYRCRRYIGQLESCQIDNDPAHKDWDADQDHEQSAADAEFIAHARQDVPALLAELDRVTSQRDRARDEVLGEVVAWLVKKAREYRSTGSRQHALQADVISVLADKVRRGAVRPNSLATRPRVGDGGPEDVPALLAEVERLRAERSELIRQRDRIADDTMKALAVELAARPTRAEVLRAAARKFEAECPDAAGSLPLCMCHVADPLREMANTAERDDATPRTERSYWVTIADALNAAHSADMPVGIDLDGTLTDHNAWSVIWDRAAERWTLAGYDDGDGEPDDANGDQPAGSESTRADFFRPGCTYTRNLPYRAPEIRPDFRCVAVAVHPEVGERRAFGFGRDGAGSLWKSEALRDIEWADGWVVTAKAGESR